ncbi:hypothetical protein TRFO_03269 [Tritrichomonas foetus]|uniref:Uncharacterized protein n=1 Tax=Tritrichomonas foetus TaxID=1144522 RepID=A0A1J4KQF8_9EUKA|nr:hypothetical protein TRFO_03269 [Tritrichomonas foetus]|eukprot:OHT13537.1 hypothetical protein TRFO_03269 [Tritrichomonas foetus]
MVKIKIIFMDIIPYMPTILRKKRRSEKEFSPKMLALNFFLVWVPCYTCGIGSIVTALAILSFIAPWYYCEFGIASNIYSKAFTGTGLLITLLVIPVLFYIIMIVYTERGKENYYLEYSALLILFAIVISTSVIWFPTLNKLGKTENIDLVLNEIDEYIKDGKGKWSKSNINQFREFSQNNNFTRDIPRKARHMKIWLGLFVGFGLLIIVFALSMSTLGLLCKIGSGERYVGILLESTDSLLES